MREVMRSSDILAVVVSYNGEAKTGRTVEALRDHVGHVHVVDNGSEASSLSLLAGLEKYPQVTVSRLGENQGIGRALNLGLQEARRRGARWLLTMDQDSVADPGMVAAFSRFAEANPDAVCLSPSTRVNDASVRSGEGEVAYAITSGNLVRLDVFDRIGLYDEDMFIDCVDFDFCLRVRAAGWPIFRVGDAVLHHQLGEPHRVRGPFSRFYTRHSPLRRYYMFRNFGLLARKHGRRFPGFMVKLALSHLILAALVPFHDERARESLRAIGEGIADFRKGRFGRHPDVPFVRPRSD
jgi:rhamnosyltransferase